MSIFPICIIASKTRLASHDRDPQALPCAIRVNNIARWRQQFASDAVTDCAGSAGRRLLDTVQVSPPHKWPRFFFCQGHVYFRFHAAHGSTTPSKKLSYALGSESFRPRVFPTLGIEWIVRAFMLIAFESPIIQRKCVDWCRTKPLRQSRHRAFAGVPENSADDGRAVAFTLPRDRLDLNCLQQSGAIWRKQIS